MSQALAPAPAAARTHDVIDPAILYFGTPVVLVSSENPDGTANLAPISSAFWLGDVAVLGFGTSGQTPANILRTREAVLSLPSVDLVDAVDRLALTTGRADVPARKRARGYTHVKDKFAEAWLTPAPSELVRPPRVAECAVNLEATLHAVHWTDMALVLVKVVRVHVRPDIRMPGHANRIDPDRWRPLIMSFQKFYGLTGQVHPSRLATIDEELYR